MKRRGEGNGINNRCVTVERCTRSQRHLVNILQTRGDNWAQWPDKGILLFQSVDQSEENFSLMYWYFVVVQLVFCSCVLKNLVLQVHSHLVWCTYKNEILFKKHTSVDLLYTSLHGARIYKFLKTGSFLIVHVSFTRVCISFIYQTRQDLTF